MDAVIGPSKSTTPKPRGFNKAPFQFKIYGRRFRIGQFRSIDLSKVHLKETKNGKTIEIKHDRSSRLNYDASRKYPHSSERQQIRTLKRVGVTTVDYTL